MTGPKLVTIKEPHVIRMNGHYEALRMRFIAETFTLSMHPGQQQYQAAFFIYFVSTPYERLIPLLAKARQLRAL